MNPLKQMKNRDRQRDKTVSVLAFGLDLVLFKVEGQILGSNPSLIRGGTTSYSFWNHHWQQEREEQEKKIADKEGTCNKERLWLNFEVNKEDRRVFLDVVLSLWFACLRKHKLGKIKSSTLLVVVQNTKPKGEQPPGNEYQNLLLYLKRATVQLQFQCHMRPNWFQCLL
ncbi:uncharacterized protein LOC112032710 isoform X2 [Quercus suber]|uniref:uncharacterized protein LOC112032710 isoform X2 n=1 Tax=Quercus suber TaxID=58331 RepID=UPI0032DF8AEB